MIDYFNEYILLAYRSKIIYLNVSGSQIEEKEVSDRIIEVTIDKANIRVLDLIHSYKIICIQPLGSEMSSIVLEDIRTRQIRFMRVEPSEQKNRLKFVQLGILVNHSPMTVSPLVKYH